MRCDVNLSLRPVGTDVLGVRTEIKNINSFSFVEKPNATFCNDKYPKSKNKDFKLEPIVVKKGASIGANATILPGVTIGENALVAAGAIVTKDVPPYSIVGGNPAKVIKMRFTEEEISKHKNILSERG